MSATTPQFSAVEVFYSYSHADELLRSELEKHLSILKRKGVIDGWHDRRIDPGAEWEKEIDTHLNNASIILFLVSADFIASEYCWNVEVKRALERHEAGVARVIPVILRPVDWTEAPFGKLQALPRDAKPITTWANQDEAFVDITRGIRNAIERAGVGSLQTARRSGQWVMVLSATIDDHNQAQVEAIVDHLRVIAGDIYLTLKRVDAGSIRLMLEGNRAGYERIAGMALRGRLNQILGIEIEDIKWESPEPDSADFTWPKLRGMNLSGEDLRGRNLFGADLAGANLGQANLCEADLAGAELQGANLREADLRGANLVKADLSGADFEGASLQGATLVAADLVEANLARANLAFANLAQANLSRAILNGADLGGVILRQANLEAAHLIGANLRKADLTRAVLAGTDFSQAVFGSTTLIDLDLGEAEGLNSVLHDGPSMLGIDTLYRTKSGIPKAFLKGVGVPDGFILCINALVGKPIDFYSCFISYSSKDHAFAERLHSDLQQRGVRCWFAPEDMKAGDTIRMRIDESIRLHDKLLLVLSENATGSAWVQTEIETALERERRHGRTVLFPIRLDDAVMEIETGWPALIRRTRHIGDFTRWKDHDAYQAAFERLLRNLKAEDG